MMQWPDDPNWQMTWLFLLTLAIAGFVMKGIALCVPNKRKVEHPFIFWLLLCPPSHERLRPRYTLEIVAAKTVCFGTLIYLGFLTYGWVHQGGYLPKLTQSYSAAPMVFLISKGLLMGVTLIWFPTGYMLPELHCRPWKAHSIANFWGHRWNLWFSDWFRFAIFIPFRRWPKSALVMAFTISGLIHEWVINVPLLFVMGKAPFGSMMVYFSVQAAGVLIERQFKASPERMRAFTWLVVLVPVPLVLDEGLLRILHLW